MDSFCTYKFFFINLLIKIKIIFISKHLKKDFILIFYIIVLKDMMRMLPFKTFGDPLFTLKFCHVYKKKQNTNAIWMDGRWREIYLGIKVEFVVEIQISKVGIIMKSFDKD